MDNAKRNPHCTYDLPKRPVIADKIPNLTKVNLISNHFIMKVTKNVETHIYSVQMCDSKNQEVAKDNRQLFSDIYRILDKTVLKEKLQNCQFRGQNLWSTTKVTEPITFEVENQIGKFYIRFLFTRSVNLNEAQEVTGNAVTQAFNARVKKALKKQGLQELGRNGQYYNTKDKSQVQGYGLEVLRGFKTSVHIFNFKPVLLIDFKTRILSEKTALEFIRELEKQKYTKEEISQELSTHSVMSIYGNNRLYKVSAVDYTKTVNSTFDLKGKQVSFKEYIQKTYNQQIKEAQQPLLKIVSPINKEDIIFLVPEIFRMTGLTDAQKSNGKLMRELANYTKLEPKDRNKVIMEQNQKLSIALQEQDVVLEKDQQISGFQLNSPYVQLGQNKSLQLKDGNFFLKQLIVSPIKLENWIIIYAKRSDEDDQDAQSFFKDLQQAGQTFGISLIKPVVMKMDQKDNQNKWCQELSKQIQQSKPQIVVSLLDERKKDQFYRPLKECCLQQNGVLHQNVLINKYVRNKNKLSVASKILIQINAKMGQTVWKVNQPKNLPKKTMIIGIDSIMKTVNKKSIIGLSATISDDFSKYYSTTFFSETKDLIFQKVPEQVIKSIVEYEKVNNSPPELLVIYRDGVGEGQWKQLVETETKKISNLLAEKYPKTKLLLILVNKRINHRFFDADNGIQNPRSGTIIADKKIATDHNDFYLVAQLVTQGTCTPTHYTVIENTTNLAVETIWELTYCQCFNYYNWSGAVRVPAVIQYADKLAFMIAETLNTNINEKLQTYLSFL